ncbi:MAG: OB-fold domain-containing protein [Chloroflexota bacterium]
MAKSQIPIEAGLFTLPTSPEETPHLLGARCRACGEVVFPRRRSCPKCFQEAMQEVALSRRGKVYTSTVVRIQPPPPFKASGTFSPYGLGTVELPEGLIVPTLFTGYEASQPLGIGTEVELVVEKLEEDDAGNEVVIYKFRPSGKVRTA